MTKTTTALLTTLLVLAHAIELTYDMGKASAPYIKATVAFIITAVVYTIDNWHKVEALWQYEYTPDAPVLKAPKRIRARRIRNTISYA